MSSIHTPTHRPCGINCIIAPYMVDSIKLKGSPAQRKMALDIEKKAASYRDDRDAESVAPVAIMAAAPAAGVNPNRRVYDGGNKATLPGNNARFEGDPASTDKTVNEAYIGAGDVFNLYWNAFGRNSLDGNGMPLDSTVHHRKNYNNAYWNGSQMAYGDGDGTLFKKFTEISVIGHEFSHGVVQFSGGLIYQDQAGALNESFADVFGSLTEQYKRKEDAFAASWLIGKGVLANGVSGTALRSMKAPGTAYDDVVLGKDPQPYHMDLYVQTTSDNGGVHINSGIPNHAFYLLSVLLGGYAWEKAGKIWYDALQRINNSNATFNDWATETVMVAYDLFGSGSFELNMTRRAWKLVGIDT